jgi:flagellar export protein FliJ
MKPFRFSLQSIRILRQQKERVAQKRYVEALRASDEAASLLDAGTQQLAAAWTSLCEEVAEGATIAKLHQTRSWCSELEKRCDQLIGGFKAAEKVAQEAWRQMTLASREREALDRLREKIRRGFDRDVQREEQKQLDEMGLRTNPSTPGLHEIAMTQGRQV